MNLTQTSNSQQSQCVLRLQRVTLRGKASHGLPVHEVQLTAEAGRLIFIQHERSHRTREFASMIQGLVPPTSGQVLFNEQTWADVDYSRHFQMRSRIGRVFDGPAWIQNANMMENVTLASRHHGASSGETRSRMRDWIKRFDIADVSRERPAFVEPALLQIYQWIRALIHRPTLLILERPMQLVSTRMLPKLIEAIDEIRREGGCVLWMTNTPIETLDPDVLIQVQGRQWSYVNGDPCDE
ncbi:ATP-binding cassette domain-containing protein [Neorhodopirellula pilleata]|uniref:Putative ABC transporter ATP-binding protein n=1 Tax=Neorhodopirellula pilleata TaxID=2714738 RepID=A0A5C6A8I5_9BACT|nr:hypothetical protein [Neorhodopirellula pilleata]TWT95700.1 putative ABC transporter ATP-binding protein [Neorhodopirellula pilleata]